MRTSPLLVALAVALTLAGCGDDDTAGSTAAGTTTAVRTVPPPELPERWTRESGSGLTVDLPPGWSLERERGGLVVRSGDRALALSLSADRSPQAGELSAADYAATTLRGLEGFRNLRADPPQAVRDLPYPTASASGSGEFAGTGVEQDVAVFAMRPTADATIAVLVFRNQDVDAAPYARLTERVLRSVRLVAADEPGETSTQAQPEVPLEP